MKANDDIPADEMLLAEAIAAAKANHLGHVTGSPFYPSNIDGGYERGVTRECCALGAIALARSPRLALRSAYKAAAPILLGAGISSDDDDPCYGVYTGNDEDEWCRQSADDGESLGWAFRCAMTQEDE